MNTPPYAAAVAKLLRRRVPAGTTIAGDEARGVATIERAMHARTRRRRLVALCGAIATAAAALLVATQVMKMGGRPASTAASVAIDVTPSGRGAALARGEGQEPLKSRVAVESGQRIDTPAAGGASLRLSTGTSMTLSGRTSFRVDSQGATQRFSLQQGELVAHVAKLTTAQRFIVDTPDAEVEVRGTRFRLRVIEHPEACGSGTRTRLEVSEGAVDVRVKGEVVNVKAGEVWPTGCSSEPRALASVDVPVLPVPATAPKREAHTAAPAVTDAERASGLTAQNDLFAQGVERGRQGDKDGALRVYHELLRRFPSSPLAENAMVERMRLLAATPEGATEARRYLARYPQGFAVGEAKKLLAEP